MNDLWRRRTVPLAIFAALAITGMSWASTALVVGINVTPESGIAGGAPATVTPMAGTFALDHGRAQTIEGVELFRVDLGAARFSDMVRIRVLLLNPDEMGRALNNPNAYLEMAAWYEDETGAHTLDDGTTNVTRDDAATGRITRESGEVLLQPSMSGVTTYYVLSSLTVPGGTPQGTQSGQLDLRFHADARI